MTKQSSNIVHNGQHPSDALEMLDPDARFLLANERTLLAWVRTGLALVVGGLALMQFGSDTMSQVGLGSLATLLGAAMVLLGYIRFRAADRAIRLGQLPASGYGPLAQVVAVIIFAVTIVVIEIVRSL